VIGAPRGSSPTSLLMMHGSTTTRRSPSIQTARTCGKLLPRKTGSMRALMPLARHNATNKRAFASQSP
jgi:hypothetical protein